jgi:hypothetical protein
MYQQELAILFTGSWCKAERLDWTALDFTIVTSTITEQLAAIIVFPPSIAL